MAPHAYYVHCTSHNLNLVLKDAMEAVTETCQFYDTIESVYNFFWHSIVRWQKASECPWSLLLKSYIKSVKSNLVVWSIWCCLCFEGKILWPYEMLDSHDTYQHETKEKKWSYGNKETDRKLWFWMHAGCAKQDFADRQHSFKSYAV